MIHRLVLVMVASMLVAAPSPALAECAGLEECRDEATSLLARLEDGTRVRHALALLARLDRALEVTCAMGEADGCRLRIQLHVARRTQREVGGTRVWNRTAREMVLVPDDTFSAPGSRLAIRDAYQRLVTLESARVEALDSVRDYEAFTTEFPHALLTPHFRRRIAELGLADVVRASRETQDLEPLFAFRLRVDQDDLVEPALFAEVLARGTVGDAERFVRELGTATSTPSDHLVQMRARVRTLSYEAAFLAGDVDSLLRTIERHPDAPEVVRAFELLAAHVDSAPPTATYDAIARFYPNLAASVRPRAIDVLTALLSRSEAGDRASRVVPLFRAASGEARARLANLAAADASARDVVGPLFDLLAAAPGEAAAQSVLVDALVARGTLAELDRYLALPTIGQHRTELVERVRARRRDARFEDALARSERVGIEPLLTVVIEDPRHPSVPAAAARIVGLLPTLSPTEAFDALAPSLSEVPAHVRESLADAAVELLVRMGTRDRYERFVEAGAHASLRQRQRLAEILREELTFPDGVAGAPLLRRFAGAFPGTAAARDALRDADAREATDRARRTRESLRERANRFRR